MFHVIQVTVNVVSCLCLQFFLSLLLVREVLVADSSDSLIYQLFPLYHALISDMYEV